MRSMIEGDSQIFVPGMAFVPEAPTISEALTSFGRQHSKTDENAKKSIKDVQNSIWSILRYVDTSHLHINFIIKLHFEIITIGFRKHAQIVRDLTL